MKFGVRGLTALLGGRGSDECYSLANVHQKVKYRLKKRVRKSEVKREREKKMREKVKKQSEVEMVRE